MGDAHGLLQAEAGTRSLRCPGMSPLAVRDPRWHLAATRPRDQGEQAAETHGEGWSEAGLACALTPLCRTSSMLAPVNTSPQVPGSQDQSEIGLLNHGGVRLGTARGHP